MRFEETVALNREELNKLLKEHCLTQSALADQMGVSRLTVGRWCTGRVRRISLDNLKRLSGELGCQPELLQAEERVATLPSAAERNTAAKLIVSAETLELFTQSGELLKYEQLLRAMAHPVVSNSELLDLYMMLTYVAGKRGDMSALKNYISQKLKYARRCQDHDIELEALINAATYQAVQGQMRAALRRLNQLLAQAESLGTIHAVPAALINKLQILRLLCQPRAALATAVRVSRMLKPQPQRGMERGTTLRYAAMVFLEAGAAEAASLVLAHGAGLMDSRLTPDDRNQLELQTIGMASLRGQLPDLERVMALAQSCLESGVVDESQPPWACLILRRSLQLETARELLTQELSAASGLLRRATLMEEQARLASASGQPDKARASRACANSLYRELGLDGRCCESASREADQIFELSREQVQRALRVLLA
ncbi:helix-turn-helix transcriptional regulator [bacterium]|nr:helix-turn-helix transcriptional regulator [bacterium]